MRFCPKEGLIHLFYVLEAHFHFESTYFCHLKLIIHHFWPLLMNGYIINLAEGLELQNLVPVSFL